jgi:hypothetical protein
MSWLRVSMSWKELEPQDVSPGEQDGYNWSPYDRRLLKAAEAQLIPIVYIWKTPPWAVPDPAQDSHHCRPPRDMQFLHDLLSDVVERYHKPPYGVKHWEIYNEPEGHADGFIGCMGDDVNAYVEVLRTAHSAIKAVDPEAKILIGGLAMLDEPAANPRFLEQVMALGGGDYFDIVSFHVYSEQYNAPYTWFETPQGRLRGLRGKVAIIRNVLAAYPEHAHKPLMLTEVAKRCFPREELCDPFELEEQSRYVVYENIRGMADDLKAIIWFTLEHAGFYHSGLMGENQEPKPAYYAYVTLGHEMYGSRFERALTVEETGDARVEGYIFTLPAGQRKWVLWMLEDVSLQIHFPASLEHLRVVDKYGSETILTDDQDHNTQGDNLISVQISREPLYIETLP